ncbi:hypothetical protein ACOMHN_029472 [Nucella lapillus]
MGRRERRVDRKEEEGGESETVSIKKGLAALLAARLHHHTEQGGVRIVKAGEDWTYDVQELGHEGPHNATYHARPTAEGVTFTKIRHNHPVAHATATYAKTMHYHDDLKVFHTVEIQEQFDVMADPPEGYDPYIKGHKKPEEEEEQPVLPSMTGEGRGKLQFLTKVHVSDVQSLLPPDDEALVTTTIHVQRVVKAEGGGRKKQLGDVMDQVTGNLTCMRTQPKTASVKVLQECFHSLVAVLTSLSNTDVTTLTQDYLGRKTRGTHYQRDKEHMMDALWSVDTEHAQNEVMRAVLLSNPPDADHVERLLYLIGGGDHLPSEFITGTVVSLTLKPEEHSEIFRSGELRHRLVLVLGIVIGQLQTAGQTERASDLAKRLQDMLGLHDPYAFRQKRSTMTEAEALAEDQWKVVLLESLGNANLDQSYEHIVSHVNNSNSQWVTRAGVHALRNYHHEHAANVILKAAMYDEHRTVRYECALEFVRHPAARAILQQPAYDSLSNDSIFIGPSEMDSALAAHHRGRRDLFKEFHLLLQSPSIQLQKVLGSPKIGASFGLTIRNALDIKIGLLSGHGKVDIFDEAYGQVNLGFMGFNVDIIRLRLCFMGHAEYNLNLFQEFDVTEVKRVVQLFDQLKKQTVGAIVDGISLFINLLKGDPPFADIVKAFGDAIKNLPDKLFAAGKDINKALEKISQYEVKALPPFMRKLRNLVLKVSNLINDIRSDVTGFYNKLMTATVVIPYGSKQIFQSVENIIDSFNNLQSDPKTAISTVTGSTLTIGIQVKAMVDAVKEAKEAAFFLKKEKPYWWNIRDQTRQLAAMAKEVVEDIKKEGPAWVKAELKEAKDTIKQFTSGKIDVKSLKRQVMEELKTIPEIVKSLVPLENLGDEIQEAFTTFFELITSIKKAYVQLKEGARKAKEFIERVFGPKVHRRFPRTTRTPGGGCGGKGFYPSTLEAGGRPEYTYEGVDVLLNVGSKVVAPFPGIIYLSPDRGNEVMIDSRGGSPKNAVFIITNIKANDTIRSKSDGLYTGVEVVAGQVIGEATSSPCSGFNHLHFAIKKRNGTIDPTRYLEPRFPEMPQWIQECDDYKYVFKGKTQAAGSIAGLVGRKPNDTSPERTPEPAQPSKLPDTKDPSKTLDDDISQPTSISTKVKDKKDEAKKTAEKSKDNVLKTLLKSAAAFVKKFNVKDMKMGSLVLFLQDLQFTDSLDKLTKVFRTIQAMLDNKPCLNPNAMSNDDLRTELRKQGKPATGSREVLIKAFTQRSEKCPLLSLGLPKQLYCRVDEQCLGVECCLDIRVAFFRKVYKMYLRVDPCNLALVVGLRDPLRHFEKTFGPDTALNDIYGGFDFSEPTPLTIDALNSRIYIKGSLEKEDTAVVLNVTVSVCKVDDDSDCIVEMQVLDRAVMPLPFCTPDGKIVFQKVDLKKLLKDQKDKLKDNAKKALAESMTYAANKIFEAIPCLASQDSDHSVPCARPDAMTEETLTHALQSRHLITSGTAKERIARLEKADRTCTVPVTGKKIEFTPISNTKLAKLVYIKLDSRCLGVEACVDIPIKIPVSKP